MYSFILILSFLCLIILTNKIQSFRISPQSAENSIVQENILNQNHQENKETVNIKPGENCVPFKKSIQNLVESLISRRDSPELFHRKTRRANNQINNEEDKCIICKVLLELIQKIINDEGTLFLNYVQILNLRG